MFEEPFEAKYEYDSNGNVTKITDIDGRVTSYAYNSNNDVTSITMPGGGQYSYSYDSNRLLTETVSATGVHTSYGYDSYGNSTSATISGDGNKVIRSDTTYTSDGNMTASVTAGDRNTVTYANDTDRSLVNSVTDAKGVATGYSYDSMRRLLATACGDAAVTNGYTDDLLSSLSHTNTSGKTTTYSFVYGAADLQTAVNIGSRNLVSNAYNSGTWTLSSQTYGNGDYWKYFYDNMDTLTSRFTNCSDNEGIGFYYTYNGKGKLVRIEMKSVTIADGAVTGGTLLSSENYLYDGSDRLIRVVETDGDNVVKHDFSWTYDAKDNVTALTESIGGKSFSYTYAYDDDSRPTSFGYGDVTKQITYDGHGRSSGTTVKNGSRTVLGTGYAYRDVDSAYTTTQVKSVTNSYGGKTANFNYTYDANGNILSVSGAQTVTYEYDDLGQLVWEKNATAGKAWNYTYDNGGNILSRTEYACSSSGTVSGSGTTASYTYGDAEWGDLLTAHNGEEISYDGIGNPLSYRGWTMSWQGGRQLASMTKGSDTLSFAYNESGLRTSKTVNGVTHNYVWQGSKLAADITDTYALYFHYDSSGEVIGFTRTANGTDTEYFYVKNLQGDILKVITATGTEAATYTYDAWGKLLTSSGDLAEVNPIRYRGYYYDTETGLYYLQSRYYDPEVGRWINADNQIAGVGGDVMGYNMFTYCMNNPAEMSDSSGSWPRWATKLAAAVAVVAVVAVVAAVTVATAGAGTAIAAVAVGAAKGAAIGFAVGAATGAAGGAISHRISTGSWNGAGEAALNGMANGALSGAVSGAITGGITGGLSYNSGATSAGKGFDTYRQLKNEIGSPGAGNEWHHIVEQSQIAKSGFSPQMIQNTNNIMSISKTTHRAISGYYSSVQPFTDGMIVRNWLAGQSFSAQYEFGINVIKMFM